MQRDFIYKIAENLSDDLLKIAGWFRGVKAVAEEGAKTVAKGAEKTLTMGEAREMGRKQMYKTIAALGVPSAYLIGKSTGKKQELQNIMNPPQKSGSTLKDESYILKLSSMFIQRLVEEHKSIAVKLASYEEKDQATKIALEMLEKGIIGPNQLPSKIDELVKNGSANMIVVMEKANKDLQLSESDANIIESNNGLADFTSYLLGN
jgi:hypothetical protein